MKRIVFGVPDEEYAIIQGEAERRGLKPHQIARSALIGDVKRSLNRSKSLGDVVEKRVLKAIGKNPDFLVSVLDQRLTTQNTSREGKIAWCPLPHLRRHTIGTVNFNHSARFRG